MVTELTIGGFVVDVLRKDIKNVHLSVHPPTGRVRIAVPMRMSSESVRLFAISKLDWIKRQQRRQVHQERETQREFVDRESHYVWGRRVLLRVEEHDDVPRVELRHATLVLRVRPDSDTATREAIVAAWYRQLLKDAVPTLIATWEPRLKVKIDGFFVQQMKTKWGSCNPAARTIRVNTELAKKPRECLEYVVVHEMAHLVDATHGKRFLAVMDRFMPHWQDQRALLNRLPLRYESWPLETSVG